MSPRGSGPSLDLSNILEKLGQINTRHEELVDRVDDIEVSLGSITGCSDHLKYVHSIGPVISTYCLVVVEEAVITSSSINATVKLGVSH